jgi:hypothetical protein
MALSRAQKKLLAIERAERRETRRRHDEQIRLQRRLDDIDWEMDELIKKVRALAALEESENVNVELEAGDATEDH